MFFSQGANSGRTSKRNVPLGSGIDGECSKKSWWARQGDYSYEEEGVWLRVGVLAAGDSPAGH